VLATWPARQVYGTYALCQEPPPVLACAAPGFASHLASIASIIPALAIAI